VGVTNPLARRGDAVTPIAALKHVATAAVFGGLAAATESADAQVWFFSRSGKSSYFAAGVHGYGEKPDSPAPRVAKVEQSEGAVTGHRPVWRETSVYEAYPPAVVRRFGRDEIIPGGYRYERRGRWE